MNNFRILLVVILVVVVSYTALVVCNHGLNLLLVFFGDMANMGWPGQFNLDFLSMLVLSAVWTAWRNNFSAKGLVLAVMAFFLGAPFLAAYLLFLSYRCSGDVKVMLLGESRATTQ